MDIYLLYMIVWYISWHWPVFKQTNKQTYFPPAHRPGPGEPAGRGVHQRASPAQPHPPQDHRDGGGRRQAVRHLPTAASQPRMRIKDTQQIPGSHMYIFEFATRIVGGKVSSVYSEIPGVWRYSKYLKNELELQEPKRCLFRQDFYFENPFPHS